jgi:voltage-dependent calcium channel
MAFLFQKLSGVFEVRIHPTASSFRDIYNNSQADPDEDFVPGAQVGTLDLRKLAKNLSTMDSEEIRRRRKLYNRLYWEASLLLSQGDVKGISFQSMLTLLSHYKLIDDEKALK